MESASRDGLAHRIKPPSRLGLLPILRLPLAVDRHSLTRRGLNRKPVPAQIHLAALGGAGFPFPQDMTDRIARPPPGELFGQARLSPRHRSGVEPSCRRFDRPAAEVLANRPGVPVTESCA